MDQTLKPHEAHMLCALTVSHYLQDLLEDWFSRWDDDIECERIDTEGTGVPAILELWHVNGPDKAFRELPAEMFATNYRAILAPGVSLE